LSHEHDAATVALLLRRIFGTEYTMAINSKWDDDCEICDLTADGCEGIRFQMRPVGHGWLCLMCEELGEYQSIADAMPLLKGLQALKSTSYIKAAIDPITHLEIHQRDGYWSAERWSVHCLGVDIDAARDEVKNAFAWILEELT
jgi:hypothetical protein